MGFPDSSVSKESACNARDPGLTSGSGRSSGVGNGNPIQYSCVENPTDRGAWCGLQSMELQESDPTQLLNQKNICGQVALWVAAK